MNAWRSGEVEVSSGRLAYHRTGGDGPPLVLSHGLTDNGLCWSRFARAMEPDYDVIMLDARGHGESCGVTGAAPHEPGRDIAEAIDALDLVSPLLMGHSVGALATAACAGAKPGRISKVVLEDPPLGPLADAAAADGRRRRFRQQVERFRSLTETEIIAMGKARSPGWHDEEFPSWAAAKRQVDPDAMPVSDTPWQDSIARIRVPTLLIYGEAELGGLVTPTAAAQAVALNPNIRTARITGAGHNVRRENFPDFLSAVRAFLADP